jgi:hypothetical protein
VLRPPSAPWIFAFTQFLEIIKYENTKTSITLAFSYFI